MSDAYVVYIRHGEKVLIMQRADEVADFPGAWDGKYAVSYTHLTLPTKREV